MKAMKHLKLAAAGMLGLFLTAQASAQAPIGQPVFEGHSASFVRQDAPVPVIDPVAAPAYMPEQQDCFGSMQSFGSSMEFAMQSDIMGADAAHFMVTIPEKAKLFVNDNPTASKGETRNFVVNRLEQGQEYDFVFRAEMENAAGVVIETKETVRIKIGDSKTLNFTPAGSKTPWAKKPEEEKAAEAPAAAGK